jgi:nucleoside-diphosphate-sugar epimerase
LERGEAVWATTRSAERAEQLAADGVQPVVVDIVRQFQLPPDVAAPDTVLFAVGYDRSPQQTLQQVYLQGLANVLTGLPPSVKRFLYISSTGVYGERNGNWVDEDAPCEPLQPGGQACLAAEQLLARSHLGARRLVLRMAGLYGPGRIPKMDAVQRGERIAGPESGYLNLIHIEDAADVVVAAEQRLDPPRTLVVADGCPVPRGDFYRELARILRAPPPRFADSSDAATNMRAATSKRVNNGRLREMLAAPLRYPSYREGLAAIVSARAG